MKNQVLALLMITMMAMQCTQPASKTLDGKSFKISIADIQQADKQDPDILSFNNGKLDSESCHQYGFTAADYTLQISNDVYSFVSTISSPAEGSMKIEGSVQDNTIKGTMVWMKAGQADIHYTFQGNLINK